MNVVFIVPTGVGAEIGGHAGDATPAARLIGSVCDRIILHPNVVNAMDINEMPKNAFYVDGNMLDEFLNGDFGLLPVKSNKILAIVNPSFKPETVNAISACRTTLGVDVEIVVLNTPLYLTAFLDENGCASGTVTGTEELITQIASLKFDALAILTEIEINHNTVIDYLQHGGVNPWGVVESMACRPISQTFRCPVAHAPIGDDDQYKEYIKTICDPRMGADFVTVAYLFCVIKGLHKAPRRSHLEGMRVKDIDLLISPDMTFGTPHRLCLERDIPILVVKENKTVLPRALGECIKVRNYVEAAGYIACMRAGITIESVRRPIGLTKVIR